jgi:hypothetical protein
LKIPPKFNLVTTSFQVGSAAPAPSVSTVTTIEVAVSLVNTTHVVSAPQVIIVTVLQLAAIPAVSAVASKSHATTELAVAGTARPLPVLHPAPQVFTVAVAATFQSTGVIVAVKGVPRIVEVIVPAGAPKTGCPKALTALAISVRVVATFVLNGTLGVTNCPFTLIA